MLKRLLLFFSWLFVLLQIQAQPQFEISRNIYRVPYANGTDVVIINDHYNHDPVGRYDMVGDNNGSSCSANYPIVAAAAGVVRRIEDGHNLHGPDCTSNCTDFNNYVWIEHANGEWTKYTHIVRNSASVSAGLVVDQCISAGQLVGYECEIGQASGPHLHFEVRHPNDPTDVQISVAGGFMTDADHRIPAICGISKNYFERDDELTAAACGSCNILESYTLNNLAFGANKVFVKLAGGTITTGVNVTFSSTSSTMLKANKGITFKPGLLVRSGAYFNARAGSCGTTGTTACD